MISRVTHATLQRSTLANLQTNLSKMGDLQHRLSSGKSITRPSDNPALASTILQLKNTQTATAQYQRNADNADGWLTTVDSALQGVVADLLRARNLAIQGANTGSMDATSREAIAVELEGIKEGLLAAANTKYMGRYVFAGTSSEPQAYDATTYAWSGSPGATVERRVADATTIRVDGDGPKAFGEGPNSLFAELDALIADVRAGADLGNHINTIDARRDALLGELGSVGTRHKQVQEAQRSLMSAALDLTSKLANVEDIDLADTIVKIQGQEVAYQAALAATQRVIQPTLLDYLR